jgi:hypothetical protein
MMLLIVAVAGGVFTYFAARVQGVDNVWRQVSAAVAVAIMLALCLMLFAGDPTKAGSK